VTAPEDLFVDEKTRPETPGGADRNLRQTL
jgi:hypothetical protein